MRLKVLRIYMKSANTQLSAILTLLSTMNEGDFTSELLTLSRAKALVVCYGGITQSRSLKGSNFV